MLVRIRHETSYAYDRPVFLEPMTIRLLPRSDVAQRLLEQRIEVLPNAQGSNSVIEHDGAGARCLWFDGMHERLSFVAQSLVETLRENPFDFLVTHEPARSLPARYPPQLEVALAPFRSGLCADVVGEWAKELNNWSGGVTTAFLHMLTDTIHRLMSVVERDEGAPHAPERTLAERTGSCRDLTMLFVSACRSLGLAARFVSGYSLHHPPHSEKHELHAWAEVYLPGGGWRGYDPTLGLAAADGHIALASGFDHELAAPVTGTFRGTDARAVMTYKIDLCVLDSEGNGERLTS